MSGKNRVHGNIQGKPGAIRIAVFEIVQCIPPGNVLTYGAISRILQSRISPLAVGWMLHRCPPEIPWHRVVNASGHCSTDRSGDIPQGLQRRLLESEGIKFSKDDALKLETYHWDPGKVRIE